jgi:hypothetical protein
MVFPRLDKSLRPDQQPTIEKKFAAGQTNPRAITAQMQNYTGVHPPIKLETTRLADGLCETQRTLFIKNYLAGWRTPLNCLLES